MKLLAIFDKKALSYHPVFCVPNMVTASRSLDKAVNAGQGDFADYPDDFALYVVGEFNEITGVIEPCVPPQLAHELKEFVKADQ